MEVNENVISWPQATI